jgi:hypothetical protein
MDGWNDGTKNQEQMRHSRTRIERHRGIVFQFPHCVITGRRGRVRHFFCGLLVTVKRHHATESDTPGH